MNRFGNHATHFESTAQTTTAQRNKLVILPRNFIKYFCTKEKFLSNPCGGAGVYKLTCALRRVAIEELGKPAVYITGGTLYGLPLSRVFVCGSGGRALDRAAMDLPRGGGGAGKPVVDRVPQPAFRRALGVYEAGRQCVYRVERVEQAGRRFGEAAGRA